MYSQAPEVAKLPLLSTKEEWLITRCGLICTLKFHKWGVQKCYWWFKEFHLNSRNPIPVNPSCPPLSEHYLRLIESPPMSTLYILDTIAAMNDHRKYPHYRTRSYCPCLFYILFKCCYSDHAPRIRILRNLCVDCPLTTSGFGTNGLSID